MRVVITGATGNLGTALLQKLSADERVTEIIGVARRTPRRSFARTRFVSADVAADPLDDLLEGADAVVHLAWRLQPSHDLVSLDRTNIDGSAHVFRTAAKVGVGAILYASSVGTYAEGPKDRFVDESWSNEGIHSSTYSRQKAQVERLLDDVESEAPDVRVVRFRPGLVFSREAASDIRRLFLGPLVPRWLFDRRALVAVPDHPRFRFQAVHSSDVGDAFRRTLFTHVRGPVHLAADPVLDGPTIARTFGARAVKTPRGLMRSAASMSWHLRLQPSEPGWIDIAFGVPLMSTDKARRELGWQPRTPADEALRELVEGIRHGDGFDTPPLLPRRGLARLLPADPQSPLARAE